MELATILTQKIQKVCPIHGVSIGVVNEKSTWRINYKDECTDEQKKLAIDVLNAFVWDAKAIAIAEKQVRDDKYKDDLLYRKAFVEYKERIPDATFTMFIDYLESIKI